MGFIGDSAVMNPPAMQETQFQSLGQEDPLEMEMATFQYSWWEIPWTEKLTGYSPQGHKRVGQDLATKQQEQQFNLIPEMVRLKSTIWGHPWWSSG